MLLATAYAVLMLIYRAGWMAQPFFSTPAGFIPTTKLSVIIPARNEAGNIAACVRSVLSQDYPRDLLEIMVVDDHSEDNTADIARAEDDCVRVLSLSEILGSETAVNAFKKRALAEGIAASRGELLVTMDADCVAQPQWLRNIVALYQTQSAAMIIGPVAFSGRKSLLFLFQSLDFTTMQGITAASHRLKLGGMANGANLAFSRAAFDAVGGYAGTEHLASGDDYLLLHKMEREFPTDIHYLKSPESIVTTAAQATWQDFLDQRVRWASKSGKYSDYRLTAILLLVYGFNVSLFALLLAGFWHSRAWLILTGILALKTIAELALIYPVAQFFKKKDELPYFPLLQPLHIAYIIAAGFLGMKGGYHWKGRNVK